MEMPRDGWSSVTIPDELVVQIDDVIKSKGFWSSRAEFVKDAVRRYLESVKEIS